MLTRLTVILSPDERAALQVMADAEMRGAREQIRFLVREAIQQRGLLQKAGTHEADDQRNYQHSEVTTNEQ